MNTDTTASPEHTSRMDVRKGLFFMTVSVACFATNSLLLKLLANWKVDAWVSMSFRFGVGLLLTTILLAPRLMRCFQSWLMASRGVLGGLGTAAYYASVGPLGAGKATLIGNTWCVFAALMATFMLGEKLTRAKVSGISIALAGLGLLIGLNPAAFGTDLEAELIALGGAILAALVVVVIRQLTRTETSPTIFASQCVYGLALALPFAWTHFGHLDGSTLFILLLAACCATGGQLAMTEGFRFLTVAAGSAFQIVLPVVISLGGVVFFQEHFSAVQALGALLILLGSFVTVRR